MASCATNSLFDVQRLFHEFGLRCAMQVWDDAVQDGCEPDCRMATTLIEVCARAGDTDRALETYNTMRAAAPGSRVRAFQNRQNGTFCRVGEASCS